MAVFNGRLLKIQIGADTVANATNCTITMATEVFETTSKDSAGNREILPGLAQWSATADLRLDWVDTGWNADDAVAAWKAKTLLTLTATNEVNGDTELSGSAYLTNVEISGPNEDVVMVTLTFEGTGVLSQTTIV